MPKEVAKLYKAAVELLEDFLKGLKETSPLHSNNCSPSDSEDALPLSHLSRPSQEQLSAPATSNSNDDGALVNASANQNSTASTAALSSIESSLAPIKSNAQEPTNTISLKTRNSEDVSQIKDAAVSSAPAEQLSNEELGVVSAEKDTTSSDVSQMNDAAASSAQAEQLSSEELGAVSAEKASSSQLPSKRGRKRCSNASTTQSHSDRTNSHSEDAAPQKSDACDEQKDHLSDSSSTSELSKKETGEESPRPVRIRTRALTGSLKPKYFRSAYDRLINTEVIVSSEKSPARRSRGSVGSPPVSKAAPPKQSRVASAARKSETSTNVVPKRNRIRKSRSPAIDTGTASVSHSGSDAAEIPTKTPSTLTQLFSDDANALDDVVTFHVVNRRRRASFLSSNTDSVQITKIEAEVRLSPMRRPSGRSPARSRSPTKNRPRASTSSSVLDRDAPLATSESQTKLASAQSLLPPPSPDGAPAEPAVEEQQVEAEAEPEPDSAVHEDEEPTVPVPKPPARRSRGRKVSPRAVQHRVSAASSSDRESSNTPLARIASVARRSRKRKRQPSSSSEAVPEPETESEVISNASAAQPKRAPRRSLKPKPPVPDLSEPETDLSNVLSRRARKKAKPASTAAPPELESEFEAEPEPELKPQKRKRQRRAKNTASVEEQELELEPNWEQISARKVQRRQRKPAPAPEEFDPDFDLDLKLAPEVPQSPRQAFATVPASRRARVVFSSDLLDSSVLPAAPQITSAASARVSKQQIEPKDGARLVAEGPLALVFDPQFALARFWLTLLVELLQLPLAVLPMTIAPRSSPAAAPATASATASTSAFVDAIIVSSSVSSPAATIATTTPTAASPIVEAREYVPAAAALAPTEPIPVPATAPATATAPVIAVDPATEIESNPVEVESLSAELHFLARNARITTATSLEDLVAPSQTGARVVFLAFSETAQVFQVIYF